MKRFTIIAVALLLAFVVPTEVQAQEDISVGARVGIDLGDVEEVFFGADARVQTEGLPVALNPTFDVYLIDPGSFWSLSGNALYPIEVENESFEPYAGAGLGIYRQSAFGLSSTDVGINLLFGAEFPADSVTPFAEAQYSPVFTTGTTTNLFSLKGGILFNL